MIKSVVSAAVLSAGLVGYATAQEAASAAPAPNTQPTSPRHYYHPPFHYPRHYYHHHDHHHYLPPGPPSWCRPRRGLRQRSSCPLPNVLKPQAATVGQRA